MEIRKYNVRPGVPYRELVTAREKLEYPSQPDHGLPAHVDFVRRYGGGIGIRGGDRFRVGFNFELAERDSGFSPDRELVKRAELISSCHNVKPGFLHILRIRTNHELEFARLDHEPHFAIIETQVLGLEGELNYALFSRP